MDPMLAGVLVIGVIAITIREVKRIEAVTDVARDTQVATIVDAGGDTIARTPK